MQPQISWACWGNLVIILLTACSSAETAPQPTIISEERTSELNAPPPTNTSIAVRTATLESPTVSKTATAEPTATHTLTPSPSSTPPQTPTASISPTPSATATPTEVNWGSLPPLTEALLSSEETTERHFMEGSTWQNTTKDWQGECLLDCAQMSVILTRESLEQLTITLIRTSGSDEAQEGVQHVYDNFLLSEIAYEYTPNDLHKLNDAPSHTWVISRHRPPNQDIVLGTSYGSIILLVDLDFNFCFVSDDGSNYCEGDVWYIASIATSMALLQLEKLEALRYPP